jgi:site-specific recombinase XerD
MTNQTNARTISALTAVEPTIDLAVATFLDVGLLGRRENTKEWYRRRLRPLGKWLGEDHLINQVLDADLLTWYAEMENQSTKWGKGSSHPEQPGGLSLYYLHSLVRAAKKFFSWLLSKRIIEVDPAVNLIFPRLPRSGRKGISDGDVAKILNLARKGMGMGPLEQARDYALLKFLETSGARLCGLRNLEIGDLNLDQPEPLCRKATVREKNDKERAIFITPAAVEAMRAWLLVRPAIGDEHVFLGHTVGREWHGLTESGIYALVKRYAKASGVKRNWNPHQWRHRFGRKLAEKGVSLGIISQIMGHESVTLTAKFYGIFGTAELQAMYDAKMVDA